MSLKCGHDRNEREGGFEEERRGKRCCGMELKREVYVLWWQEGERSEVSGLAEDQEVGGVGREASSTVRF